MITAHNIVLNNGFLYFDSPVYQNVVDAPPNVTLSVAFVSSGPPCVLLSYRMQFSERISQLQL